MIAFPAKRQPSADDADGLLLVVPTASVSGDHQDARFAGE
jgi:hypothetical protein